MMQSVVGWSTVHRQHQGRRSACSRLPVVPRMAPTERDVLHLEEVTTSVILKRERDKDVVKSGRIKLISFIPQIRGLYVQYTLYILVEYEFTFLKSSDNCVS